MSVCAHENAAVRKVNFKPYTQFRKAMAAPANVGWLTDEVWQNPYSQDRKVLIYVAPVRTEGVTVGVCYLEFDFEGQAAAIMGVITKTAADAVASIVDGQNRVVASTGSYTYLRPHPHALAGVTAGRQSSDGLNIAQAVVTSGVEITGLQLKCVIEEHVATEEEITTALSRRHG